MTRENKLALVVGFGLILFVGILISDHFSVARTQGPANLADQKIADPLVSRTRDEPDLIALRPPPPPQPHQQPEVQAQPAVNPSEFAVNTPQYNESMSPEQRSMIDRNIDLSSQRSEVAQGNGRANHIPDGVEPVPADSPASNQQHANVSTVKSRDAGTIDIEGFVPVESETQVSMKDVRFHDVRGGESLFSICKDYYDDISLVDALAKFNKMNDASQIRAGRRLLIPPASAIGGKPSATVAVNKPRNEDHSSSPRGSALVKQTTETSVAKNSKPAAAAKTYTVKAGDSLSSIAQRFLGDREKWRDLHKLNKKVIDDPDNLKVGTVIRLL